MRQFRHFACIDWSGAVGPRQRGIAVAICSLGDGPPTLVRPDHIWSRTEILEWLRNDMPTDCLVGMDLGPALPFLDQGAYFPGWKESPADARQLWALVEKICNADPHLAVSSFVDHPEAQRYFRRQGKGTGPMFGSGRGRLRVTELAQGEMGLNPYSNFNLVGAAQVGKSSLTGMRVLHRLCDRMPIWPFDPLPKRSSLIVEIYTSLAALEASGRKGRSKMRSIEALNEALASPAISAEPVLGNGVIDDHKTDALLTAAWMRRAAFREALWRPPSMNNDVAAKEGWTFGVI